MLSHKLTKYLPKKFILLTLISLRLVGYLSIQTELNRIWKRKRSKKRRTPKLELLDKQGCYSLK